MKQTTKELLQFGAMLSDTRQMMGISVAALSAEIGCSNRVYNAV